MVVALGPRRKVPVPYRKPVASVTVHVAVSCRSRSCPDSRTFDLRHWTDGEALTGRLFKRHLVKVWAEGRRIDAASHASNGWNARPCG